MNFGRQILDFDGDELHGEEPFAVLESRGGPEFWDELRARIGDAARKFPDGAAIGFVGYEATRSLDPRSLPLVRSDDLRLPQARLVFYKRLIRTPKNRVLNRTLDLIPLPDWPETRDFYQNGVAAIREWIAAGDIYQANLTYRFSLETSFSSAEIYQRLQSLGVAPRAALLEWSDFALVSNSPETFLTLRDGTLEARPIKGTIRRGQSREEDEKLRRGLEISAKNRAENVMIVDLMRNDLGRVCEFGSVMVPSLYQIETYPTLHHGVSTVRGRLRHDRDALDAFLAAFPCGSITGAPKMRAMQILNELEPMPRGAAMGAIGYFGFGGDMEWSVAIRTTTLLRNRAYLHVGGGIVADSEPRDEYEEMRLKASALYSAIRKS